METGTEESAALEVQHEEDVEATRMARLRQEQAMNEYTRSTDFGGGMEGDAFGR